MSRPMIAVTMGDPAGVGPELCLRIAADAGVLNECVPVIFGDASVLRRVGSACGLAVPEFVVPIGQWGHRHAPQVPAVVDCAAVDGAAVRPGTVQKSCGLAAHTYIEKAVRDALTAHVSAVVTAPINKEALNLAGILYPGHTEILAALTGAPAVCMMLASETIVVSLATVHVRLSDVAAELTAERVLSTIELTASAMGRIGRVKPLLTVCALNPHAGEHGLFGSEEEDVILPAVAEARRRGHRVVGPLPPDTAFLPQRRRNTDAYVAMYHDQGLIPFKMLAFDVGVNVTLGLPIVRTSVDHGTAFDIAWQGKASATSLREAIRWAARLAGAPRQAPAT